MVKKLEMRWNGYHWSNKKGGPVYLPKVIKAIWKQKNVDIPIEVVSILGHLGGVFYLGIKGSKTGIPENEVVFEINN